VKVRVKILKRLMAIVRLQMDASAGGHAMIQTVIKKVENATVLMFPYLHICMELESAKEVVPAIYNRDEHDV